MYRKEEILSLLKDPTNAEAGIENDPNQKPKLKWHKVGISYLIAHDLLLNLLPSMTSWLVTYEVQEWCFVSRMCFLCSGEGP